jgi:hypothetical protein
MADRIAEIAYSKDHTRLEALLPHKVRVAELPKIWEILFSKDIIERLPRGCPMCLSGDHFVIRERLEHVIRVDLDKRVVIGP